MVTSTHRANSFFLLFFRGVLIRRVLKHDFFAVVHFFIVPRPPHIPLLIHVVDIIRLDSGRSSFTVLPPSSLRRRQLVRVTEEDEGGKKEKEGRKEEEVEEEEEEEVL